MGNKKKTSKTSSSSLWLVLWLSAIAGILSAAWIPQAIAAERHVHPGDKIQSAIDAASNSDVIIIHQGTYKENIEFFDKFVTIRSEDPNDPAVVAATIIDGNQTAGVVYFGGGSSGSQMSGLTLQNGNAGKMFGGGICCWDASPTITNCTVKRNSAGYGAGIAFICASSQSSITNCTISGNSAAKCGGGILCLASSPHITNCTISGNKAGRCGWIASDDSSPVITNCIVWGNFPDEPSLLDHGFCSSLPEFDLNHGFCSSDIPDVTSDTPIVTYSDIQGGYHGEGNINVNPEFVNSCAGDYHLQPGSPCINAGITGSDIPAQDKDGNQRDSHPDQGAYEYREENVTPPIEEDVTPPRAWCKDITVQLNENGEAPITAADIDNGSSDDCEIAIMRVSPSVLSCTEIGTNTVTLVVTDTSGNKSSCTASVLIEDKIAPQARCKNITVHLDESGKAAIRPEDINNGSSDNCEMSGMSVSPDTLTDLGPNPVTLTVTDAGGNTNSCTASVNVVLPENPVITCPENITVEAEWLDRVPVKNTAIQAFLNGATATDAQDGPLTVTSDAPKAFFNYGKTVVTFKAKDKDKNISSCTAEVNVVDTTPPVITCPEDITLEASGPDGACTNNPAFGALLRTALARDTVTPGRLMVTNNAPTAFIGLGETVVTFKAMDKFENTMSCTATVTVRDTTAPLVRCRNLTVQIDENGTAAISAADINNGSSDNCGIASMRVSPATFDCTNIGPNTVTLTVTDTNGNVGTCQAIVTVKDRIAPQVRSKDMSVQIDENGKASISASDIDNGSADNCEIATMRVSPSAFGSIHIGKPNTVSLTVTDTSGNWSRQQATVTVVDNTAPQARCKDITVKLDARGNATIKPASVNNGSSDNVRIASMSVFPSTFTSADIGPDIVTLTVTDTSGNSSTCQAAVMVEDAAGPAASGNPE
jgi:parallel beta-helix repeat protein